MDEIGKASLAKVLHLVGIILEIWKVRVFNGATTLYYPPAGPDKTPIFRDIAILLAVRWMFRKTIFHFHAGGVSEVRLARGWQRYLFDCAYRGADCSILLSELNPHDGKNLAAHREVVIPYGIEDHARGYDLSKPAGPATILFVGIIRESKGILVLIEACRQLAVRGSEFRLEIMGKFESPEFEKTLREKIDEAGITKQVYFLGVLSDEPKFAAFRRAAIFCFPTFFESETFGVVLLEAMQFSIPVVATRWRGVPSIVENEVNGFIVPPKDARALVEKLSLLLDDPQLRNKMGVSGRSIFLQRYTIDIFYRSMGQLFDTC